MKKVFDFRKLTALIASFAVVAALVLPATEVKSWADEPYTYNIAPEAGALHIYNNGRQMGASGTIPSGATLYISNAQLAELTINGLSNNASASNIVVLDQPGKLYVLSSKVDFVISGLSITFTKVTEETKKEEVKDEKKVVEDQGPQWTAEQIAWAQKHDHASNGNTDDFVWNVQQEATSYSDGKAILQCPECGYVAASYGIPAGDEFLKQTLAKVRAAKSGQTINIEAKQWYSFPQELIDAIAAKSAENVTFDITFKYDKVLYDLIIPANISFANVSEEQSKGLLTLAGELGLLAKVKSGLSQATATQAGTQASGSPAQATAANAGAQAAYTTVAPVNVSKPQEPVPGDLSDEMAIALINSTPTGGSVTLHGFGGSALSPAVVAAIVARSDVSITLTYYGGGSINMVSIPAGANHAVILNSSSGIDFSTLAALFGSKPV